MFRESQKKITETDFAMKVERKEEACPERAGRVGKRHVYNKDG